MTKTHFLVDVKWFGLTKVLSVTVGHDGEKEVLGPALDAIKVKLAGQDAAKVCREPTLRGLAVMFAKNFERVPEWCALEVMWEPERFVVDRQDL